MTSSLQPVGPLASTGYWLKLAALAWQRELDAELRAIGLTAAQQAVLSGLAWLGRRGGAPTQQQVASLVGIDRMLASRLVAALVDRELVAREVDGADARKWRLRLTDQGGEVAVAAAELVRRVDRRLFGTDLTLRNRIVRQFAGRL